MVADVSRLGIEVSSSGIKEAEEALKRLALQAKGAEEKVLHLGGVFEKFFKQASGTEQPFKAAIAGSEEFRRSLRLLANQAARTEIKLDSLGNAFERFGKRAEESSKIYKDRLAESDTALRTLMKSVQETTRAMGEMVRSVKEVSNVKIKMYETVNRSSESWIVNHRWMRTALTTLQAMTTATVVYGSLNLVKSVVTQADAWALMRARLTAATGSMEDAVEGQEKMYQVAQRLRAPVEDTVKLYQRLYPAMSKYGKTADDVAKTVENLTMGLKLSGAAGQEVSSVLLQLSQSASSGVINGAEFSAVAEGGGMIMRALEGYYKKNTSELKKMGSQGKLTFEMLVTALDAYSGQWRKDFANMPITVEDAFTIIRNSWIRTIGEMGQKTDFNKNFAEFVLNVEKVVPVIATTLVNAVTDVTGVLNQWFASLSKSGEALWKMVTTISGSLTPLAMGLGKIFGGINDEFNLLGAASFGVMTVWKALWSLLVTVGGVLLKMGATINLFIITPLVSVAELIVKTLAMIGEAFMDVTGDLASTLGLEGVSDWAKGLAADMKAYQAQGFLATKQTLKFTDALNDAADAAFEYNNSEDGFYGGLTGKNGWYNKMSNPAGFTEGGETMRYKRPKAGSGKTKAAVPTVDKGAQKSLDEYQDAMGRLADTYKALWEQEQSILSVGTKYEKLSDIQRTRIRLEREYADAVASGNKLEQDRLSNELSLARLNESAENRIASLKDAYKVVEDTVKLTASEATRVEGEADQWRKKAEALGLTKGAVEELTAAQYREKAAAARSRADEERLLPGMAESFLEMASNYDRLAEAADKKSLYKDLVGAHEAAQQLDKMLDPGKAEKFGESLKKAFGEAGVALGGLVDAFRKYADAQDDIGKMEKLVKQQKAAGKDVTEYTQKIAKKQAQSQITAYGDIAEAGKSFFSETSKGYKALEAAEKAFRLFEMAMAMESYLTQTGLFAASVEQKVAGEALKSSVAVASSAMEQTAAVASMNTNTATESVKQGNNATTALTSALAAPFPANIAAYAMVAAMLASIGVAVSGGGGGGKSVAEMQETQSTGTVLGDSSKKSESIANALELLSENSNIALKYSSAMLASLQNIETALTGVSTTLYTTFNSMTDGLSSGQSATAALSKTIISGALNLFTGGLDTLLGVFGSKTSVKDYGIAKSEQSMGDILSSGYQGKLYTTLKTESLFDSSTYHKYELMSDALEQTITNTFVSMANAVQAAGEALGMSSESVLASLSSLNVSMDTLSLKGLTSDEINDELSAWLSSISDEMVSTVFGSLVSGFQQGDEGMLETLVRVASGVEEASFELNKLGVAAINYTDIINKQGDVGAEIVRQSLLAVDATEGILDIISTLSGTASEIAETYSALVSLQDMLMAAGLSTMGENLGADLLNAAGGLEALQDATGSFVENFYTDAEQQQMAYDALLKQFTTLGLTMPASTEAFRALVESLDASGDDALAAKVILLSEAFAELMTETDDGLSSLKDALAEAYNTESAALESLIETFAELEDQLLEFRSSLLIGDLSTGTPSQKYQTAGSELAALYAKALTGDSEAMSSFQDSAQSFLELSRELYASSSAYTADYMKVLEMIDALSLVSVEKQDVAQLQLDAMTESVSALIDINESVISVADAIAALQAAMAGNTDGSHKTGLSYVPFDGYVAELHKGERVLTAEENSAYDKLMGNLGFNTSSSDYSSSSSGDVLANAETKSYQSSSSEESVALLAELKALRQEVASLREERKAGDTQLATAYLAASKVASEEVVDGVSEAVSKSSYVKASGVSLV